MSLSQRLDKLEAISAPECRTCAGEPLISSRESGDPPSEPCPECGRMPFEFTIRIDSMERDREWL